ncbi:hypothetical protein [Streptomyces johnsoniae]|uniref:Glycolipid-binding domain-containing protein n=1 Tax=Streptomyces johnsoniae TaxID=3075532 RepID=A0ABU2RZF3_9ACTN|nr:hypothetical protein [Streptomyces sp. DSM 41886]MDT0441574.1 hypothetical protein [Streptomyces sp. DSM 41886]
MPRGTYSLHDPHDRAPLGEERFHCAPGPTGWRYVSTSTAPDGADAGSVDLTLDALGRPVRLELRAGGWQVRGAALDGVTWVRMAAKTGEDGQERNAAARAFTGDSPAFLIATARLLRPATTGAAARVRLIAFAPPVLAPRTRTEQWTLTGRDVHTADGASLAVDTYRIDDLDTGERRTVHLSGDVVLAAPGVELEELDTPPSDFTPAG